MFTTALGAKRRPLMPSSLMAVSTWPMIMSPSRKLWWKEMVMPSLRPLALMASAREESSLDSPGTTSFCRRAERTVWSAGGVVKAPRKGLSTRPFTS